MILFHGGRNATSGYLWLQMHLLQVGLVLFSPRLRKRFLIIGMQISLLGILLVRRLWLLTSCYEHVGATLHNTWVDVQVDNQAVIHAWNNQGGRSPSLNNVLKRLFFTTVEFNICLRLVYVSTKANPADLPSRRLSLSDSRLTDMIWTVVQREFGGPDGHTCDLMALESNALRDYSGNHLPFFSPWPSPGALGMNLSQYPAVMRRPFVFPPLLLVGPVLRLLQHYLQSCTIVVLDVYPR